MTSIPLLPLAKICSPLANIWDFSWHCWNVSKKACNGHNTMAKFFTCQYSGTFPKVDHVFSARRLLWWQSQLHRSRRRPLVQPGTLSGGGDSFAVSIWTGPSYSLWPWFESCALIVFQQFIGLFCCWGQSVRTAVRKLKYTQNRFRWTAAHAYRNFTHGSAVVALYCCVREDLQPGPGYHWMLTRFSHTLGQ